MFFAAMQKCLTASQYERILPAMKEAAGDKWQQLGMEMEIVGWRWGNGGIVMRASLLFYASFSTEEHGLGKPGLYVEASA